MMKNSVTYDRAKILKMLSPKVNARYRNRVEYKRAGAWESKMARLISAVGLEWLMQSHGYVCEGAEDSVDRRAVNVYLDIIDIALQVDALFMRAKLNCRDAEAYKLINKLCVSWDNLDGDAASRCPNSFYIFMEFCEFDFFRLEKAA